MARHLVAAPFFMAISPAASSGAAVAHELRDGFIFRLDVLRKPVGDELERGGRGVGISGFRLSLQFMEPDHEALM